MASDGLMKQVGEEEEVVEEAVVAEAEEKALTLNAGE